MITNASPSAADFDETTHALKYAAIAREINCQPVVFTNRKGTVPTHTASGRKRVRGGGGVGKPFADRLADCSEDEDGSEDMDDMDGSTVEGEEELMDVLTQREEEIDR